MFQKTRQATQPRYWNEIITYQDTKKVENTNQTMHEYMFGSKNQSADKNFVK